MSKAPTKKISWKINLSAAPDKVFRLITTDRGREMFWADKSRETGDGFVLEFASGEKVACQLLEAKPPESLVFEYFGGSRVEFTLHAAAEGGTDFEIHEPDCTKAEWLENYAGWVAWLYCLKGAADYGITLRSGSSEKTWNGGFVDG